MCKLHTSANFSIFYSILYTNEGLKRHFASHWTLECGIPTMFMRNHHSFPFGQPNKGMRYSIGMDILFPCWILQLNITQEFTHSCQIVGGIYINLWIKYFTKGDWIHGIRTTVFAQLYTSSFKRCTDFLVILLTYFCMYVCMHACVVTPVNSLCQKP